MTVTSEMEDSSDDEGDDDMDDSDGREVHRHIYCQKVININVFVLFSLM